MQPKKKKRSSGLFMALVLIVGFVVMLYPTVSKIWNRAHESRLYNDYNQQLAEIDVDEKEEWFESALDYNKRLVKHGLSWPQTEEEIIDYNTQLNIDGSGKMGYLYVPTANINIPVYHGTGEDTLQMAAGHMKGTSLPVGTVHDNPVDYDEVAFGSHCYISGHRGLPSAALFTDLDLVSIGDLFYLDILDHHLTYQVDEIKIVEPDNLSNIGIDNDHDYCTLVTCTPYGLNTHRLLVRGIRIESENLKVRAYRETVDALKIDQTLVAVLILLILMVTVFILQSIPGAIKKRIERRKEKREYRRTHPRKPIVSFLLTTGKVLLILILDTALFLGAIHIPTFFVAREPYKVKEGSMFEIPPNEVGIRYARSSLEENGEADYDGDGLSNSDEIFLETNPRSPDTDGDGLRDGAELFVYGTAPKTAGGDSVTTILTKIMKAQQITYAEEYTMNGITLWATDFHSRLYGTVAPGIRDYRFSKFDGWAHFPSDSEIYAYSVTEDGVHHLLQYSEERDAWRVEAAKEDLLVEVYDKKLETYHVVTAFGHEFIIEEGSLLSRIADKILPEKHSFVTHERKIEIDMYTRPKEVVYTEAVMPEIDRTDHRRFSRNMIQYSDILTVYEKIRSGIPVAVSLQSDRKGETICMVYGFTEDGDLMIADENGKTTRKSKDPMSLKIEFHSQTLVNESDSTYVWRFFDFSGIGFDSKSGDRIYFIGLYPEEKTEEENPDAEALKKIIEQKLKENEDPNAPGLQVRK